MAVSFEARPEITKLLPGKTVIIIHLFYTIFSEGCTLASRASLPIVPL